MAVKANNSTLGSMGKDGQGWPLRGGDILLAFEIQIPKCL